MTFDVTRHPWSLQERRDDIHQGRLWQLILDMAKNHPEFQMPGDGDRLLAAFNGELEKIKGERKS